MRWNSEVIWKLRASPQPVDLVRRPVLDRLPVELDRAGRNRQAAGHQVEQRGLAGAVRPDDRMALAARNREADPLDNCGSGRTLVHVVQRDGGRRRSCGPALLEDRRPALATKAARGARWAREAAGQQQHRRGNDPWKRRGRAQAGARTGGAPFPSARRWWPGCTVDQRARSRR